LLFAVVHLQAASKVYHSIVAADGSGDYTSVQDAINAVPENNVNQYLIYINSLHLYKLISQLNA
ncbi:MAG: hypothetical protein J6X14_02345, partial [Lachnospiraceae bacterium]|nr:hypothetical protein [Lachnospiraceae bacterium]